MNELETDLFNMLKTFLSHDPYIKSECGGLECFYCCGPYIERIMGPDTIKHEPDCTYVKAEKLIKKVKKS